MASRLILRIQERSARLTSSEKKIAKVLLQNQTLVETHTATELAAKAGVSKATTARFFRSLGYVDFEEVRLQAREERNRREPYSGDESTPQTVAFGRAISEVGAVMIVGGNIRHSTRVMTTSIALATSMGELAFAVALGIVLLLVALVVNIASQILRNSLRNFGHDV